MSNVSFYFINWKHLFVPGSSQLDHLTDLRTEFLYSSQVCLSICLILVTIYSVKCSREIIDKPQVAISHVHLFKEPSITTITNKKFRNPGPRTDYHRQFILNPFYIFPHAVASLQEKLFEILCLGLSITTRMFYYCKIWLLNCVTNNFLSV